MKVDQAHLRRLLERGDHGGFIQALEPLCHRECRRVASNGIEYEDLVQEARFAVLKVARSWSPGKGANPLTLAVRVIRNHLWKIAGDELRLKRKANQGALRLDAPANPATTVPLGEAVPARGPAIDEIAEQHLELATITRRLTALPMAVRVEVDGLERGVARQICAHVAAGGDPIERVVYLSRRKNQTADGVMRKLTRTTPGCLAVSAVKRKLRDGRECAPQGRPAADGSLGELVWRIDLVCLPQTESEAA